MHFIIDKSYDLVAPLVGAWIEILYDTFVVFTIMVAPLVGAWIEIRLSETNNQVTCRRSPRGSVD